MSKIKKVTVDRQVILGMLQADINKAKPYRDVRVTKVQGYIDLYLAKLYGNEDMNNPRKSKLVSNDLRRAIEWIVPRVKMAFLEDDIISAEGVTFEDSEVATETESVINHQFCRGGVYFKRERFIDKLVRKLYIEGTVIVKTGWRKVTAKDYKTITNYATGEKKEIEYDRVLCNRPTADVMDIERVLIDPSCGDDLDAANFVAEEFVTDYSTLSKDVRYDLSGMANTTIPSIMYQDIKLYRESNKDDIIYEDGETTFTDTPRAKFKVIEYWGNIDLNGNGIAEPAVVAWIKGLNKIIRCEPNPYPDKEHPFIVGRYIQESGQMDGTGLADLIRDLTQTKTAIGRGIVDNMINSNNGSIGYKDGTISQENLQKMERGEIYSYWGNPSDIVFGNYNPLPQSVFAFRQDVSNTIDSTTGIQAFSQGFDASLGSTATETKGIMDSAASRELDTVRNIAENVVKPVLRKWISYNKVLLAPTEVVRLTNREYKTIKRDDLKGYVDIDIKIKTAGSDSQKAETYSFLLQALGQSMDADSLNYVMAQIVELSGDKMLAEQLRNKTKEPDPMEVKKAELEIKLLENVIANEVAKGKENAVDVELKSAKTRTEEAKAVKTEAEARTTASQGDLLGKKFLDEMDNMGHNRDMEKLDKTLATQKDIQAMKEIGNLSKLDD